MKYFITILIAMVLNGCALAYPLNMNEEQFLSLSQKEQMESLEKQAVLDNNLKIQRIKKQMQQKQYQHELQLQQNNQIHELYTKNRDKVAVTINDGSFKNMRRGYYIAPFELVKFEVKRVPVYSLKNNNFHHYIWVSYQDLGLYVGVKVKKQYKGIEHYISLTDQHFNKLTYAYKPAVIVIHNHWDKVINKRISFKGSFDATNLNVIVYVKNRARF